MFRKKNLGFTIVETVIAVSILGLIMAAAFPLADQILCRIYMTRDHYIAATICQARIERARQVPYSDLILLAENASLVDDFGNIAVPEGRFRRSTVLQTDTPVQGMTQMSVTVDICMCTRWGWRRFLHPLRTEDRQCRFENIQEQMTFLLTEYEYR